MPVGTMLLMLVDTAGMAVEDSRPLRTTGTVAVDSHPQPAYFDLPKITRLRPPGRAQTNRVLIVVSCFFLLI